MSATQDFQSARDALRDRDWPKAKDTLRQMFPASTNSKYIADLMRTAASAQKNGDHDQAEQALWLAVEIYESGRDENADVLTAIRMLADTYTKTGRSEQAQILNNRTFMLVLVASEGLLRSVKSLTKQLAERESHR